MKRRREKIGLEELNAFLDGYLDPEQRAEVLKVANQDPMLFAILQDYSAQIRGLHALYDPILQETVPARLRDALRKGDGDE